MIRDRRDAADSMRRNRFEFAMNGGKLPAEEAWSLFKGAVERHAPPDRTIVVRHEDLTGKPRQVIAEILAGV